VFQVQLSQPLPPPASDGSQLLGSAGVQAEFNGRLLRLGPGDVVLEAYLLKTPETTIGRTVGEVLLPDDPFVSSRHAAFVLSSGGFVLKDLGSTNGCFLRIRARVAIEDGDHLLVGHHLLKFNKETHRPA
jgi:pSer/pThr/pTyr-binding forkhead associated (FHA) protein